MVHVGKMVTLVKIQEDAPRKTNARAGIAGFIKLVVHKGYRNAW